MIYPFTKKTQQDFGIVEASRYGLRWLGGGINYHKGVDFAPTRNLSGDIKIIATANGVVRNFIDQHGGLYCYLVCDDGQAHLTVHHSEFLKKDKQRVSIGHDIALMGSSGNSSGKHVHFEVRQNIWDIGSHYPPYPFYFLGEKKEVITQNAYDWNQAIHDKNFTSDKIEIKDNGVASRLVNDIDSMTEEQKVFLQKLYEFNNEIPASVRNTKWLDTVVGRYALYLEKSTNR